MNIFLPYENDILKSVQSLDDKRLNKQILECKQLLSLTIDEKSGLDIRKRGYRNHPIYMHYKQYPNFIGYYAYMCCMEYEYRFHKKHSMSDFFIGYNLKYILCDKTYVPFYMEGQKGKPNCIRTTENVSSLYQNKLINKWLFDKYTIRWTNRDFPEFFTKWKKERMKVYYAN